MENLTNRFNSIEKLAAAANYVNSMSDYKDGSATATIQAEMNEAAAALEIGLKRCLTDAQKEILKSKYNSFLSGIVAYYESYYKNEASCPSVLVSGPANFPTRKKAAQNSRRDSLIQEYKRLQALKDSLKGSFNMSLSSDDPQALEALKMKLEKLKQQHEKKIRINAYFRKNKTFKGCPEIPADKMQELEEFAQEKIKSGRDFQPFASYNLTNENAEIKRLENRIQELTTKQATTLQQWNFNGGRVEIDKENNRIGVYFDERMNGQQLEELERSNKDNYLPRLLWSPRFQRWQCQFNEHNLRRLQNSNTFKASDEESQKAIEEDNAARKAAKEEATKEERAAKEEKEQKSAAAFAERAHSLQEKQDNLIKKTGFALIPSMLAYTHNNLSEYMKAGHGIKKYLKLEKPYLLTVEISFISRWNHYSQQEEKKILLTVHEAEEKENCITTGSGYMTFRILIKELNPEEKRTLKALQDVAEEYNAKQGDKCILALYQAYKAGKFANVIGDGFCDDGKRIPEQKALEFLKNWNEEQEQEEIQQEAKAEEEQPQQQEENKQSNAKAVFKSYDTIESPEIAHQSRESGQAVEDTTESNQTPETPLLTPFGEQLTLF